MAENEKLSNEETVLKEINDLVCDAEYKTSGKKIDAKITIKLLPVGDTPKINDDEFSLKGTKTIGSLMKTIKNRYFQKEKDANLLFYCSQIALCPSDYLRDVYNHFKVADKLNIYYAFKESWG